MKIILSSTFDVLVDDATNGFYSTTSGIVTTAPSGGAQVHTVDSGSTTLEKTSTFSTPLVVTAGQTVTINAILAGVQSFAVTVSGGNVTVGSNTGRIAIPDFVATVGTLAKIAHYSRNSIGTAGSYCSAGACYTSISGYSGIDVFYTGASTVGMVGVTSGGNAGQCASATYPSFMNGANTYQGMDSSSYISWAQFSDQAQSVYTAAYSFIQKSTIGESTTLYCKSLSADPAPTGGSYASGAPAGITTSGTNDGTFVLVAQ